MSDIIGPDGSRIPMEPEMAAKVNEQMMRSLPGLLFGKEGMPDPPMIPGAMGSSITEGPELISEVAKSIWEGLTSPIVKMVEDAKAGRYSTAPGQEPSYDPTNPLFATAMGIGAGWKGGLPAGETGVGLLAGTKAAKRPTGLSNAVEMKSKGVDIDSIWKDTGWRSDPKGNWAFEIDDSLMKLNQEKWYEMTLGGGKTVKLGELIDHPQLFDNYPQAMDIKVRQLAGRRNSHYDSKKNEIVLGGDNPALIHEIQHAIQEIEGWPKGGSPTGEGLSILNKQSFWQGLKEEAEPFIATDKVMREQYDRAVKKLAELETNPSRSYRNLFGEFQARDSASRAGWDAEARKTVRPYSSEMEPKEGWIYKP